jgi:hypothetical protein
MGRHWLGFARTAFYTMLFAPVLIWLGERYCFRVVKPIAKESEIGKKNGLIDKSLLALRFVVGSYFFVVICMICLLRG